MTDRTTKILLFLIAVGLLGNLAATMTVVQAQQGDLYLSQISASLRAIATGTCTNRVLCGQ